MRSAVVALLFVGACIAFRAQVRDSKTVKVSVYYESQSHRSKDFMNKQLWPHYMELEEALIMDLIPYGRGNHTVVEEGYEFKCAHGDSECLTNKLHACIIKKMHGAQTKTIKLIKCLMNKKDQMEGLLECLTEIHLSPDVDKFKICANSTEGDTLLFHHGERTKKTFKNLESVPKIVFNDKAKIKHDNDEALEDFRKPVCQYVPQTCIKKNIRRELSLKP